MSLNLGGIDLNSGAASFEGNGKVSLSNGVGDGLLESSKSEAGVMEPSSDYQQGGVVGVGSVEEARVSINGKGGLMESVGNVSKVDENGGTDLEMKLTGDANNGKDLAGLGLDGNIRSRETEEVRQRVLEEGCFQRIVGEFGADNLVVDLSLSRGKGSVVNESEINGELVTKTVETNVRTEKEGEYRVSDLVWAKVKSHPWWPGQIFDPSASTNKAKKYIKKDGFLIAYFGDQTFAWNEASKLKPFRMHFSKMVKQSNTDAFCHAVDCALDEVSRRVEFGLACSCLSEEVCSKIKSQIVVNAGIRKESSRIDGGDDFSSVATFKPANILQYVQDLAKDPFGESNKLEFTEVGAQLSAFYRWKGYHQLRTHQVLDGQENKFEDNSELPLKVEEKVSQDEKSASPSEKVLSKNGSLNARDGISKKRKHVSDGSAGTSKKERCMSDLMSGGSSGVPNGENKTKGAGSKRKGVESNGSREESQSETVDRKSSISSPKKLFRVGDSIKRIARQLSESPSMVKKESQRLNMSMGCPPVDEILSHICLGATNPMEEHHNLLSLVEFSSDFRNYCREKNSRLREEKDSMEKTGFKQAEENAHESEATEAAELKGTEDSYRTARIIEKSPDEQVLSEPKSPITISSSNSSKENSAAALILKFTNLDSIPSVTKLNEIFRRFGPLREMETEVLKKNNCAKVVFERRSDADTAFSSSGKFSIFGHSLISYRVDYSPTPRKTPGPGRKQNRKDVKSVKAMKFKD